jgi:peroxiredoxin
LLAKLLADDRRAADPAEWLRPLADHGSALPIETQNHRLMGCLAPAFSLKNHRDQAWSLESHFAGRAVVLVFYLGYYCDACVHHLFELNADCARFQALGAEIVAVSGDSPAATREQFERFGGFQFTVLSDPEHAVARSYGTFQPATFAETEKVLHGTFVIGPDRLVQWAHCGEAPFRDVTALLATLAQRRDRSFAAGSPLADHCPAGGEP